MHSTRHALACALNDDMAACILGEVAAPTIQAATRGMLVRHKRLPGDGRFRTRLAGASGRTRWRDNCYTFTLPIDASSRVITDWCVKLRPGCYNLDMRLEYAVDGPISFLGERVFVTPAGVRFRHDNAGMLDIIMLTHAHYGPCACTVSVTPKYPLRSGCVPLGEGHRLRS